MVETRGDGGPREPDDRDGLVSSIRSPTRHDRQMPHLFYRSSKPVRQRKCVDPPVRTGCEVDETRAKVHTCSTPTTMNKMLLRHS